MPCSSPPRATNVVKHARASQVSITLRRRDALAYLAVADDGRGVTDAEMNAQLAAGHIGLSSRRTRVEAAGGRFVVTANQPTGTVVQVQVPAAAVPA